MQSPLRTPDAALEDMPPQPRLASLSWTLRRAALWLTLMIVMVVVGMWLFYASIEAEEPMPAAAAVPAAEGGATPR